MRTKDRKYLEACVIYISDKGSLVMLFSQMTENTILETSKSKEKSFITTNIVKSFVYYTKAPTLPFGTHIYLIKAIYHQFL